MKIPHASQDAIRKFEENLPRAEGVEMRKVVGQPSAFVSGNMFFGVFGDKLFLRLSESDRLEIAASEGAKTFEPMPGRAMKEYVTLPDGLLRDRKRLSTWLGRSVQYATSLPGKAKKNKAPPARP